MLGLLRLILSGTALSVMILPLLVLLPRLLVRMRSSEIVVLASGGFGYTVVWPDILRRYFRDKPVLLIMLGSKGRYNPWVTKLFSDIDFIVHIFPSLIRIFGREFQLPIQQQCQNFIYPMLGWIARVVMGKKVYVLPRDLNDVLPEPHLASVEGRHFFAGSEVQTINGSPRHYRLRVLTPALPARLPEIVRREVKEAIAAVGPALPKVCSLYLRARGTADETETFLRSGGPVSDYIPAISELIDRGYRIYVTGDRQIEGDLRRRFGANLIDAASLSIDPELFAIYAATECDIWIGEDGGGTNVAMVADRPMLGINWFPYYAIFPGITLFYKYLLNPAGELVPPSELFNRFTFDTACTGYTVANNSAEEIKSAAIDFLDRFEAGQQLGLSSNVLGPMVNGIWFDYAEAFISPIWLRRFHKLGYMDQDQVIRS